ncbi:MAG: DUF11 domain-containing protein [Planctomycetota bacterium]|nr:MAG: DUF11 domain-containing protein [Planctomycetota bacterium]
MTFPEISSRVAESAQPERIAHPKKTNTVDRRAAAHARHRRLARGAKGRSAPMRWAFWLAAILVTAAGFYAVGVAQDASRQTDSHTTDPASEHRESGFLKTPFRVRSALHRDDAKPSGRVSWQYGAPRAAGTARHRYTRSAAVEPRDADHNAVDRHILFPSSGSEVRSPTEMPSETPVSGELTAARPLPPSLRTGPRRDVPAQDAPTGPASFSPPPVPTARGPESVSEPFVARPGTGDSQPTPTSATNHAASSADPFAPQPSAGGVQPAHFQTPAVTAETVTPAAAEAEPEAAAIQRGLPTSGPPELDGAPALSEEPPTLLLDSAADQQSAEAAPQVRRPNVSFTPVPDIAASPTAEDAVDPVSIDAAGAHALPAGTSGRQPHITLNWQAGSNINVGQQAILNLRVRNSGQGDAHDVEIQAFFPISVRLTDATPKPDAATDRLLWKLETLAAGEEKSFQITLIPSERGHLKPTATVRYSAAAASEFTVREPMLKLAVRGPQNVMMGDPASQVAIIGNPGTGAAENVTLEVRIPDGLEHPRGKRLALELGTLNPGETRTVRLSLVAVSGGTQTLDLIATADGGLKQAERVTVTVIAPQLQLAVKGPGIRYLGRTADYTVTIHNHGEAPSNNVQAVYQIPKGFRFISADRGAHFDASEHTVHWFLGRLEPNQTATVHLKLAAAQLGEFVHRVRAASEHGISAQAETVTRIDGTASLIMEVVDLDDPVEVGAETAYQVRVRNEGSKAATNVGLACELPAGVQLIDAEGPSGHVAENGIIVFKPLAKLAPKQTATFRVRIRPTDAGDQRFRVRLTSDSIQEPLLVEELTKTYRD